jgi:hypothetical protein
MFHINVAYLNMTALRTWFESRPGTSYPQLFHTFLQSLPMDAGIVPLKQATAAPFCISPDS